MERTMKQTGKVYLLGAGPGAADLITLRGARLLARADVLLYDRLVGADLLDLVGPEVKRVYVGKTVGENHDARQERIHTLMIGHALAGKTVVRLKGGDPFVFGRGGEELLALAAAGVEAEVVPGISSALAGPAAALIPVTHRGSSGSLGIFTARGKGNGPAPLDWHAAGHMETRVFLMGVERLPEIARQLIAHGCDPATPAAVVERAHQPNMRVVSAPLHQIATAAQGLKPPSVIVVGEVVRVRERLTAVTEQLQIASAG